MTVETATIATTTAIDLTELEATFDGFRSRIAMMSIQACGTLTSMFTPLGPVELDVIDIEAMEQVTLELVPTVDAVAAFELIAA